jgi:hypothetical protein
MSKAIPKELKSSKAIIGGAIGGVLGVGQAVAGAAAGALLSSGKKSSSSSSAASDAARKAQQAQASANAAMAKAIQAQTEALRKQNQIAEKQLAIATERHKHWQTYFKPIEVRVARDAEVGIDPNQRAARASSDVGHSFDQAQGVQQRTMERMGINPNSGRYVSGLRDVALARAAATAGVMNQARTQADQINWDRRVQAAALGAGMPMQSAQIMDSAAGTIGSAANSYASTQQSAAGLQMGQAQMALNSYQFEKNMQLQKEQNDLAYKSALISSVGNIAGSAMMLPFAFAKG